jgi:hypothetical protein
MPSDTAAAGVPHQVRRVSWGAIFAGTIVAMALMVFFGVLGIAMGASAVDPLEGDGMSGFGSGAAVYTVVTQILSLVAGGFVAGRLAGIPRMTAAILHGASVWSLSTLFLAWAAVAGAGALFNAASSVLTTTVQGTAQAVQTVVPEDVSFPDLPDVASQISIEDLPEPIRTTLEENDITPANLQEEVREALSRVVSEQERAEAVDLLQSTLADALQSPGDIGEDLNAALDRLVGGPDAILSEEDRTEALNVLQRRLGLSPAETEEILQTVETRIDEAIAQLRETIDSLQQQAVEAADEAASVVSTTAWWLAIASLFGLAAAMGGAFLGKPDGILGDRLDDRLS